MLVWKIILVWDDDDGMVMRTTIIHDPKEVRGGLRHIISSDQ